MYAYKKRVYSSCSTWYTQGFFTGPTRLVVFINSSLMQFQDKYIALFLLFSVTDGFEWFWIGSLHKNIQLALEFLKVSFVSLHFSCYILMTFLMLSVILLSMLMILLSILNMIKHLICDNNCKWLLNLKLIYATLWTGAEWLVCGLLISMLEKVDWFHWTGLITMVLLMWKRMDLFLRKNHLLRCRGWFSLLNWIGLFHYIYC